MIKYDLTCKCGKAFESWFPSSAEYDVLRKKKIIRCIYCDSASIKKSIMAPHLSSKSNKNLRKTKLLLLCLNALEQRKVAMKNEIK